MSIRSSKFPVQNVNIESSDQLVNIEESATGFQIGLLGARVIAAAYISSRGIISKSFNIASCSRVQNGTFQITLSQSQPDTNYMVHGITEQDIETHVQCGVIRSTKTVNSFQVAIRLFNDTGITKLNTNFFVLVYDW